MFTGHRTGALNATIGAAAATAAVIAVAWVETAAAQIDAGRTVERIGDYVARYYERAQSLIADETVSVQPLTHDLAADGFPRRLMYELRLEWTPGVTGDDSPANVTRQLLAVNGKPPRPGDEPECLDPKSVSPEPLAFLLPDRRDKFTFASAGLGRVDGRPTVMVDYRSAGKPEPPKTEWHKDCGSTELPGRSRGRIWADPETAEILRLDEQLIGIVDIQVPRKQQKVGTPIYMTIERADTSISYRRVTFHDPDETILLPARIESVNVIRNSGVPRVRITQTFTNYRRFITGSRVVQ